MKVQKIEKNSYEEMKEDERTCTKVCSTFKRLFVGEQKLDPVINRAIVSCTYFQILETLNIIVLFSVFSQTNSQIFSLVMSALCFLLFLIQMIPRISKKHLIFYITSILQGATLLGACVSFKIIGQNYNTFYGYCQQILTYYTKIQASSNSALLQNMCSDIQMYFQIEIGVEGGFIIGKIIHFCLIVKAYKVAKLKHDEEEKKKRRKDRYNEMLRKKFIYDEKRKI